MADDTKAAPDFDRDNPATFAGEGAKPHRATKKAVKDNPALFSGDAPSKKADDDDGDDE